MGWIKEKNLKTVWSPRGLRMQPLWRSNSQRYYYWDIPRTAEHMYPHPGGLKSTSWKRIQWKHPCHILARIMKTTDRTRKLKAVKWRITYKDTVEISWKKISMNEYLTKITLPSQISTQIWRNDSQFQKLTTAKEFYKLKSTKN